jgi:hypothetical protein
MPALTLAQLTEAKIDGLGAFDVLMHAHKAHLDAEYEKNRIRGADYATVYLGSLQAVLSGALQFLIAGQKAGLEADLIAAQVDQVRANIELVHAQKDLAVQEAANAVIQGEVLTAQKCLLQAQFDQTVAAKANTEAQTGLITQRSRPSARKRNRSASMPTR